MPDAFMATTTSPGPGVGSGNSRTSSFRPPRNTTPRIRSPFAGSGRLRRAPGRILLLRRSVGSSSQRDLLLTESKRGIPRDGDGVLHALMRGTALQMDLERALGRLARLGRHRDVIVDVNRLDPDRLADAGDAAVDRRLERITIERDLAPYQGATQRAVHSPRDGRDDVIEGRCHRRPFLGAVVLAQGALDAVD